jgi:hypothetical protein
MTTHRLHHVVDVELEDGVSAQRLIDVMLDGAFSRS